MKKCKEIENNLPFYAEGLLSDTEKMFVEEHLAECADCSKALNDLQKVATMTKGLSEIEAPPWFKQKIMARIRKEAEKKSFAQKWFYPLRIKIPVQVMATIVIAVLAVYIYRSGDEQMKTVLPQSPQPVMEIKQKPTPVEMSKAKKAAPAQASEEKSAVIGAAKKDQKTEVSSGASVLKMEMQRNKLAGASDKFPVMKGDIATEKELNKYTEMPALQEAPHKFSARQESMQDHSVDDSSLSGTAKKNKLFKSAAPATPRQMAASITDQVQPTIYVYVADVNRATAETEKILEKNDARKVTKRLIEGKAILQVEFPANNLKILLSQLRSIGRVEERNVSAVIGEQDINVMLEIISN